MNNGRYMAYDFFLLSLLFMTGLCGTLEDDYDEFIPFAGKRFDGFDWRLCREVSTRDSQNAAVSPTGVKLVLALLYEATTGRTADELQYVLQLPVRRVATRETFEEILRSLQEKREGYTMNIANKVYLDQRYEPHPTIKQIYRKHYKTEIEKINFQRPVQAVTTINSWVANLTRGRITKIVNNDSSVAKLVSLILNVIYFKAKWKYAFPSSNTTKGLFQINSQTKVEVNYMHLKSDLYYSESPELDAKVLRLPYEGKKYSMFLILPNKPENFHKMLEVMNPLLVREQMQHLIKDQVHVILPKFKFDYTIEMKEILQKIGITQIFQTSEEIKLTSGNSTFIISKIVQKVGLEVNEEGTVASSVTDIELGDKFGIPTSKRIFNASHPFMFFIEEEKTGTVIFVGKVVNPNPNQADLIPQPLTGNYELETDNKNLSFDITPHQPNDSHIFVLPKRLWSFISNGEWLRSHPWSKPKEN